MKYSQNNEEEIILNYFGDFKGTLLDIGANDGVTNSNSRALILNGWSGIMIEPSKAFNNLEELYKDNPHIACYRNAVGKHNEMQPFYECSDSQLSSLDKTIVGSWAGTEYTQVSVSVVTFDYFSSQYPHFDFITIDTELMDWEILQQIDLKAIGCKCLCIEHGNDKETSRLMIEYCERFGMKPILKNFENFIFVTDK